MIPYWILFLLFALPALAERSGAAAGGRSSLGYWALALFTVLMIGLRFQVGGDYETYQKIFESAAYGTLAEAIERGDPGYQFINWAIGHMGGAVWQVNLICAAIFGWGLFRFCRTEPSPVLAALVAVPYLIIVVAMGYTRQAVAIGFILAGIASLVRGGSIIRFIIYVAFAALFHRTAVIVLPFVIFAGRRNRFLSAIAVVAAAIALYDLLLRESVDILVTNYVDARYESQGAAIRVAMNLLPAILILWTGDRLGLDEYQRRFWRLMSVVALACVPALALIPSSTAVDRVALYLLPLQMVGIGRAIFLSQSRAVARLLIVAYCGLVLFVWLNFAAHAFAWVPYRTILL